MFILTHCSLLLFNMFMSGVILQVRGRDGVCTLQNGAAPYSQSGISLFARVPSVRFSSSCPIGHSVYGCTCVLYIGLRTTVQQ